MSALCRGDTERAAPVPAQRRVCVCLCVTRLLLADVSHQLYGNRKGGEDLQTRFPERRGDRRRLQDSQSQEQELNTQQLLIKHL